MPHIFSSISNFVIRILNRRGIYGVFCYLDDYIIVLDSFESCQKIQMELIHVLIELGFGINWAKCTTPSQKCRYLGIEIDSKLFKLSLPADKLQKFHRELQFFFK